VGGKHKRGKDPRHGKLGKLQSPNRDHALLGQRETKKEKGKKTSNMPHRFQEEKETDD